MGCVKPMDDSRFKFRSEVKTHYVMTGNGCAALTDMLEVEKELGAAVAPIRPDAFDIRHLAVGYLRHVDSVVVKCD